MKLIFAVVTWLLGIYFTDVYAEGTEELNPIQKYVKKGQEIVLQCIYADKTLIWAMKINGSFKSIASADAVLNITRYKTSTNPDTGLYYRLHVLNAQPDDEGIYRCEKGSLWYYFKLTLYLPPTDLYFYRSINNTLEGTEGLDLLITCKADGGKPLPNLSILNTGSKANKAQEVSYTISKISRDHHQKWIVCQATSDALDNPETTAVQIFLKLKPLMPFFNKTEVSTQETLPLIVSCTSYGSRPSAMFEWIIDGSDVTSFSTLKTVTESNDTKTVISTLTFSVNKTHNNKKIICQAFNTVGRVNASKTLDVKYAPDITVNSRTYSQNNVIRTVVCNPSGNPASYIYSKWQHKSRYGELIREFNGSQTLRLPDVPLLLSYQDGGEYVCTASNGIKDKDNKFDQTGYGYVTINAEPVFTSDNIDRVKQFGESDKAVDMYVNVYSVPKYQNFIWNRDGKPVLIQNLAKYETSISPTIVMDTIHDKEVQLDGYNVTLTIRDLKAVDFTNYTVTLQNRLGSSDYTIILESASRPEIPGNFSNIASSSTSITVQWDPNSNGGYKQTFYIQYRVQGASKWTIVQAGEEDVDEQRRRRKYEVTNLEGGTAYELRMYAENKAMKRSNFTEVLIELTSSSDAGPSTGAIIGGVAGSLIGVIMVLLVILCVLKKRKERASPSMKLRTSSEAEEDDGLKDNILYESSQSDGLKKNVLYQSAGPNFGSQNKTSTSSEYAVVQKPNEIYAEVNKDSQHKKAKAKKQKDQKEKPKKAKKVKSKALNNNPEEEYANSALPLQHLNEGEYTNSTDTQGPSGHHTNAQGLEYADLTFRQIPAKNKKQVIHGNDERTIYADVDHTKKAPPPPPESEYEETNIKHGKIA